MEKLTLERLDQIEQDWTSYFDGDVQTGFSILTSVVRKGWDDYAKLQKELNEIKEKQSKDDSMRLLEEINNKDKKINKLAYELVELDDKNNNLTEKCEELKKAIDLSGDEKLTYYITVLEGKLKKRFEEGMELRASGKISETTMTILTIGYQLVYMAKEAYRTIVRELEKEEDDVEKEETTTE
jgi:predicted RNase H-like nuclease (RuvC/YqgF family)